MKKMILSLCAVAVLVIAGCGGGGSSGSDLSCAPGSPDDPTYDLSGDWTLSVTLDGDCPVQVTSLTCSLAFSQNVSSISITGSCVDNFGNTVTLQQLQAILSGSTFYWGGSVTYSEEGYSETSTINCTSVEFTSETQSGTISGTVSTTWSTATDSGTCTATITGGNFTKN